MVYRSFFPRDFFSEFDRLQHAMQQAISRGPSIRGRSHGFPAINVGGTANSVDIYVFAPGVDPAALDVQYERGTLSISGERKLPDVDENANVHIDERFAGRFRRVVSLPDDVDPSKIEANYRNGVLHLKVVRSEESQPRRIPVQ